MSKKIAVIGGGASGVMCAISAKRADSSSDVMILEKNNRILKKVLSTGNGRCNFTNMNMDASHYFGDDPKFIIPALEKFGVKKTLEFFEGIGVLPKEEEGGKVFPMSLQASSIVDMLRFEAERLGVTVITDFDVNSVEKKADVFYINKKKQSDAVVIATGGCASSGVSNSYDGYNILKDFGHEATPLSAALVQLRTEKSFVFGLQGIKVDACVKMKSGGKILGEEHGELLFADYGISGNVIFSLSKLCHFYSNLTVVIDFFPSITEQNLTSVMKKRKQNLSHLSMENFFSGLINKKLGQAVAKQSGIENLSVPVSDLPDSAFEKLARHLKHSEVSIIGTTGFKNAQVTAGGIRTNDFEADTMQSKLVKNLYATGEVLDIFGDCGGYNLQWAWSSGYLAGINTIL